MLCIRLCSTYFTRIHSFTSQRKLMVPFFHFANRHWSTERLSDLPLGHTATKGQSDFCELTKRMGKFNQYLSIIRLGKWRHFRSRISQMFMTFIPPTIIRGHLNFWQIIYQVYWPSKTCKVQRCHIVIRNSSIFFKGLILVLKLWTKKNLWS